MPQHHKINYIELPSRDLAKTKAFFNEVFGWEFVDYGEDYTAFSNEGLDGGFFRANLNSSTSNGAALVIFYSEKLEATQSKIEAAGGNIVREIFTFPGGRRFHFTEPCGNEFAIWSDQ